MITAYLQDADGNERTLNVTSPDPDDGTYCVHMDDQGQSWIRIVPKGHDLGMSLKDMHKDDPTGIIDHLLCDAVTSMLEIPGVRDAVLVAALNYDQKVGYVGVRELERVGDIPFQHAWDTLLDNYQEKRS